MKYMILFLSTIFSFLAMAQIPDKVEYYSGTSTFHSGDGEIMFVKVKILLKRTISQEKKNITELLITEKPSKDHTPKDNTATLTQIGLGSDFNYIENENGYSGEVKFKGTLWDWGEWSYNLTAKDKSKLIGEAKLTSTGLKIKKTISTFKSEQIAVIEDELEKISANKYNQLKLSFGR